MGLGAASAAAQYVVTHPQTSHNPINLDFLLYSLSKSEFLSFIILLEKFHDFRKAYTDNGMSVDEFDAYGTARRTLRKFLSGYAELTRITRELMLPNPDNDE